MICGVEASDLETMDLFPYEHVGEQASMVDAVREAVDAGRSIIIESGTGTGKTVVSLTGALESTLGSGKKVIYLTRTKSQQRQVMIEAERISKRIPLLCVALQGRNIEHCPMMSGDPELATGTSEELARLCSEFKKSTGGGSSCDHYDGIGRVEISSLVDEVRADHPGPERFAEQCLDRGMCPYETVKLLLPHADVIVAPYPFIFVPFIRDRFMDWIGRPISEVVMVVDEAHNLPDYLRDVMTVEYTSAAMDRAEKEAMDWNDPEIYSGIKATDVIAVLRECLRDAMKEYLHEDDGLIPYSYLQDELMGRLGMSSNSLNALYKGLMDAGEAIREKKKAQRKLPRSYIASLGKFLMMWNMQDEEMSVCLVVGGENPKFQGYCLDPYPAAEPLRVCQSSIHLSGTLSPLDEYGFELGLESAVKKVFRSPFPKENLKVLYVDDVSTKYDDMNKDLEIFERIKRYILDIVNGTERNTAVFFPSYSLMQRTISDISSFLERKLFVERKGMPQAELMEEVSEFRMSGGGVLFAVTGGRISEGLDFPDKDLEVAILVGIPYPKPTARQEALRRYCDMRFGDGWGHSSRIPATRKMRQSIGRLIRSEKDRGVAVILDRRIGALNGIEAELTDDPLKDMNEFFSGQI